MKVQLAGAMGGLFLLGALWGYIHQDLISRCVVTDTTTGVITEIQKRGPSRAQYVVTTQTHCSLLVTTNRFPELYRGNEVYLVGASEPISDISSDYDGFADYLNRQGIDGTILFPSVHVLHDQQTLASSISQRVSGRIRRLFREPEASVVLAMLTGDRGLLSEVITETFQSVGISHVLAISGLHISVIAGLLLFIFTRLPLSPWLRTLFVVGCLWVFVVMVGFPVSALRASLFWTLGLIAYRMQVLMSLTTIYILTIAFLVSVFPPILRDVGFQLSFVAVAGIGLALFIAQNKHLFVQGAFVSFGAFFATLPIVSYYFGIVALIGLLANIVIIPLVSLLLPIATFTLLLSFVLPSVALIGSACVRLLFFTIFQLSQLAHLAPLSVIEYTFPLWLVFVWYVFGLGIVAFLVRVRHRSWRELWA